MERRDEISVGGFANNRLFERLAMTWDALNAGWNRWVLSFGPESQATLLNLAGISESADHSPDRRDGDPDHA